ncbi:MAG: tRNA (guanine-N(1)-)-methyltransferase, tRNA (guanine37-N1)-methyltransferase [candidate division WS6 bacterium GW2011_GWC1_33_20]|uniref:tRNA (guanine-N(1)-)-methyltransferase n=2 Tax=Candidatus Dojkabacteria TaxID=74243 RepID=A0A0G0ADC8_9BACT|nr:MAG: tRNA (guanine-N(1)-)-methyltransferase, tRNA (guanine37-N1)-methyltransferase [candidate division WS6 bacterium GW2011_GWC1_33_20]KKP46164.1 MAG: tRNA (guanine-N(1)-)-methyltransferase, tRNA (guanine37-N1)-methyltransferase [candidate division WS6 bacterium GW2011_GWF1_33_233]KKP54623.1 MAG: tRNA (guanine-N(1)-)-methyltransferase [candidate division WS6 bacterium GW2011_GWB1_33_6]KKP55428.1 MAG: tRNA (guanine-N(1)-)-methyltransferase, tRNA (guanine37-N1)-methyltransferase [candidate divi
MIEIEIITIFPEVITEYINSSIVKRAQEKNLLKINVHNLRTWALDKHKTVDDTPYGGGPGMLMKVEPIFNALKELKRENSKVFLTSPKGEKLVQSKLEQLSKEKDSHYIIICGHYEGFDQRVHDYLIDYEFSIGDYVLSGGELPALVLVDGITRLIPGVLGNKQSLESESFNNDSLDFPQYTKPESFNNWKVPEVLLSGNHKNINEWRRESSKTDTLNKRPDLGK